MLLFVCGQSVVLADPSLAAEPLWSVTSRQSEPETSQSSAEATEPHAGLSGLS